MKSKSLLIFLLGCSKMLVGQDSLTVETVQDSAFVAPQYSSVYDDVFMNKKETKWLFKVDWMGYFGTGFQVHFEHKLSKNISMNYTFGGYKRNGVILSSYDGKYVAAIEPRFYLNNNKEKEGKTVSNLNGNYIGLKAQYSLNKWLGGQIESKPNWSFIASYGIQRRVFNRWYVDYQLGIGGGRFNLRENKDEKANDIDFWFHNKFTLGLAFGGGKKSPTNKCDLFNCFEEESSLWKFDIRDIYEGSDVGFTIKINPEYERKIGKTPFSINTGLGIYYGNYDYGNNNTVKGYGLNATIEPRYYYNMKKRINSGKSANNLSGNYFSIKVNGSYGINSFKNVGFGNIEEFNGGSSIIEPRWGIQRRLFKNGFLDLSLSPFFIQQYYGTVEEKKSDGTIVNSTPLKGLNDGFSYAYINMVPLPRVYFKIGFAF
jgi:hypothetical protein